MPTQQRGRSLYLDYAKAIGILLVVVGHARFFGDAQWAATLNEVIYSFHMPLFLFVSGYVYIRFSSSDGYAATVRKKTRRLMVPYLAMSVLLIVVKLLSPANDVTVSPVTPMSLLRMFYRPEAGYFLWFIYVLWELFLVTALFTTSRSRRWLLLAAFVLLVVPVTLPDVMCLNQLKSSAFFFVLGCVAADNEGVYGYLMRQRGVVALTFLLCGGVIVAGRGTLYCDVAKWVMPIAGTLMMLQLSQVAAAKTAGKAAVDALVLVAAAVYFIYLFHTLLMGGYTYVVGLCIDGAPAVATVLANIGLVAFGVLAPTALYWLMHRYPSPLNELFGIGRDAAKGKSC